MDIKLKKSKTFIIWLCFFVGVSIVTAILTGSIILLRDDYYGFINAFEYAFKSDVKDTVQFRHTISLKFNMLAEALTQENYKERLKDVESNLDREGKNLIYYVKNLQNGVKLSNSKTDLGAAVKGFPTLPEGYDYYLYFDGEKIIIEDSGKAVDIYDNNVYNAGYSMLKYWGYLSENIEEVKPELSKCQILLIVKKDIEKVVNGESQLYQIKRDLGTLKSVFTGIITVFLLGCVLIILSIINWKTKREFDRKIGKFLSKFWIEIKVFAAMFILFVVAFICYRFNPAAVIDLSSLLSIIFVVLITGWSFYILFIDLLCNKRDVFSHNSINSLIKAYRSFESKKSFQKGMLFRIYALITAEVILILLAVISLMNIAFGRADETPYMIAFLIFIAVGVYLIYRYIRRYNKTVTDIGKLIDQIEAIKNGDIKTRLILSPGADMYNAAQSLNKIQNGINKAVEDRIKSERTKVELITNVSHDLKTPLTSIISYVDLLSKEEGLPEHVNDYIKILQQKSDRLKTLISDLFDLTKAASGEINVDFEKIDLGKLVRQTLADLNDEIMQSGLAFKVNVPEYPIFIMSDGKKLYRVFLNLISNTLKYSLAGSRVYIDLIVGSNNSNFNSHAADVSDVDSVSINRNYRNKCTVALEDTISYENAEIDTGTATQVTAIIKNIANYEMSFSEDEILERFARGDKARSSEGSGLGLAIAQSFTHVCGGKFNIAIDGDMFKVILKFKLICDDNG